MQLRSAVHSHIISKVCYGRQTDFDAKKLHPCSWLRARQISSPACVLLHYNGTCRAILCRCLCKCRLSMHAPPQHV